MEEKDCSGNGDFQTLMEICIGEQILKFVIQIESNTHSKAEVHLRNVNEKEIFSGDEKYNYFDNSKPERNIYEPDESFKA